MQIVNSAIVVELSSKKRRNQKAALEQIIITRALFQTDINIFPVNNFPIII